MASLHGRKSSTHKRITAGYAVIVTVAILYSLSAAGWSQGRFVPQTPHSPRRQRLSAPGAVRGPVGVLS